MSLCQRSDCHVIFVWARYLFTVMTTERGTKLLRLRQFPGQAAQTMWFVFTRKAVPRQKRDSGLIRWTGVWA